MKYLLVFLASLSLWASDNKIVYMVIVPRSMSTATFRAFENRDDFIGFHEPTLTFYKDGIFTNCDQGCKLKQRFISFNHFQDDVFKAVEHKNVIVKDGGFSIEPFILSEEEIVKDSKTHFVFVVRHPYKILKSIYKKNGFVTNNYFNLAGVKQLYQMYEKVKSVNPNKAQLLFVDDLLEDPENALRSLCVNLEIPFSEKSLNWEVLDETFSGESWHEQKCKCMIQKWHNNALRSTCIKASSKEKIPLEEDMFKDAKSCEDRELLLEVYKYHLPFYEKFLSEKGK